MSEDVAIAAQKASAPIRASVASSLATEASLANSCPACGDKDFSDACPLGWMGMPDGGCAAPESYAGVCGDKQFFLGASVAAKMEAEVACAICWPCAVAGKDDSATCKRDWAQPCPNGYTAQTIAHSTFGDAGGVSCGADFTYEGECEQQVVFNDVAAKQRFAQRCQTSWPCFYTCKGGDCAGEKAMIQDASGSRLPTSAAFLAARVLPVDGYRIRNSLFLSQLLRMPASAALNIVEQEDASRVYEVAKYKSMEDQALRLDGALETKFRLLSQS
jgi:CPW-WPC domain-containing protein